MVSFFVGENLRELGPRVLGREKTGGRWCWGVCSELDEVVSSIDMQGVKY